LILGYFTSAIARETLFVRDTRGPFNTIGCRLPAAAAPSAGSYRSIDAAEMCGAPTPTVGETGAPRDRSATP
jgi:hypothetical protein